ncbi:alcohol dehydrogenase catalytic domain-containing protein [Streptomyces sp. NPDC006012]|uniref:alcohol dehydrogenase catalytic domain-containing protein n=1 Tax=Streptomyces sp. NPDC006012 TaxID=3364739 RepID=UPI0036D127BA
MGAVGGSGRGSLAAASVNPIDAGIAAGCFEGRMPHVYPLVLGVDGAGRVVRAGEAVRGPAPGDIVHGQFLRVPLGHGTCTASSSARPSVTARARQVPRAPLGHGTFAEYAVVTEHPEDGALQRVPDGMPADIAAALPTAGTTALGVVEAMGPQTGRSILINGATGGVAPSPSNWPLPAARRASRPPGPTPTASGPSRRPRPPKRRPGTPRVARVAGRRYASDPVVTGVQGLCPRRDRPADAAPRAAPPPENVRAYGIAAVPRWRREARSRGRVEAIPAGTGRMGCGRSGGECVRRAGAGAVRRRADGRARRGGQRPDRARSAGHALRP